MQVYGKHIVVIGAARSGLAAARLLHRNGARVLLTDSGGIPEETCAALQAEGVPFEQGGHSERAFSADLAVVSPGVPDEAPIVASYLQSGRPLISEMELASTFCKAPMVAVTGSNGKTTVVSWLDHVWKIAGVQATAAGNIGTAFSDIAETLSADQWALLEVSSFQLDHIDRFHPRVSCILNITPDHLDRYQNNFDLYAASKMRIRTNQSGDDIFIYWNDDQHICSALTAQPPTCRRWSFSATSTVSEGMFVNEATLSWKFNQVVTPFMPVAEVSLPGTHNLLNAMAVALIARAAGLSDTAIRKALSDFRGVEHRLEKVRELNGVTYYNDSKATNVDAVFYALGSMAGPIVLIMGGQDKGNDYTPLLERLREKTSAVIAIGKAIPSLTEQVKPHVRAFHTAATMEEAVGLAQQLAAPGSQVLLSPACASFDMFQNYEHRGRVFKSAVMALEVTA